jgi:hypothetical protein
MLMTSHRTMTGDRPDVGVGEGYRCMVIESACPFRCSMPLRRFLKHNPLGWNQPSGLCR